MTLFIFRAARASAFVAALSLSTSVMAHEFKLGDLEIIHPWSKEAPAGAKVAGGYIVVKNNGAAADRLTAATGEVAGKTEIHDMSVDANGVMTMRQLADGIEIPAGGQIELKPGGKHIMFMNLTRVPKEGEKFKGTLTFEKAGTVNVEFSVDKPKPGEGGDHSAH